MKQDRKSLTFLFGIGIWWWNANAYYGAHLAKVLLDNGHDIWMSARKGGPPFAKSKELGLDVYDINYDTGNPFQLIMELIKLKQKIRFLKPDILVPVTSKAHFLMSLYKILFDRKIKIIRLVADVRSPKANLTNRWFYNRWTDYIVASANVCKERVISNTGFDADKIDVIYLGYPVKDFHDENIPEIDIEIKENDFVILFIGRFAPEKSPETLIKAISLIKSLPSNVKVIMSGDETSYTLDEMKAVAARESVPEKFIFIHRVDDVRSLLKIGDLGIITSSESEVVCRIATEYMIFSLPVIGTDVNVIPEMITPGVNGDIYKPKDEKELAVLISEYIQNPERCKGIGTNNYETALQDFSYENFYASFINVCNKLELTEIE